MIKHKRHPQNHDLLNVSDTSDKNRNFKSHVHLAPITTSQIDNAATKSAFDQYHRNQTRMKERLLKPIQIRSQKLKKTET